MSGIISTSSHSLDSIGVGGGTGFSVNPALPELPTGLYPPMSPAGATASPRANECDRNCSTLGSSSTSSSCLSEGPRGSVGESTCEEPERYVPGGLHPTMLGDIIDERYRIVHKLGHGTFSAVWLAENMQFCAQASIATRIPRYVALKVWAASARETSTDGRIMEMLTAAAVTADGGASVSPDRETGCRHIAKFYEGFTITGPNGTHSVHVMEFVGPTLSAVKKCREKRWLVDMELDTKLRLVSQLAAGLVFLHSQGVVHADLHLDNVAFAFPNMDKLSTEEVLAMLGAPHTLPIEDASRRAPFPWEPEGVRESAHLPSHLVHPPNASLMEALCTGKVLEDPSLPSLRILDFGESFLSSLPQDHLPRTPNAFSAPELLVSRTLRYQKGFQAQNLAAEMPVSFGLDTWSFGALVYHIISPIYACLYWHRAGPVPFMPRSMLYGVLATVPSHEDVPLICWRILRSESSRVVETNGIFQMVRDGSSWSRRLDGLQLQGNPEVLKWIEKILRAVAVVSPIKRRPMSEIFEMIPREKRRGYKVQGQGEPAAFTPVGVADKCALS